MREPLVLNNHCINRHAKFLLTRVAPSRFYIQDFNSVPPYPADRGPQLYLFSLLEWFIDEHSREIGKTKTQHLSEKLRTLLEMPASRAWEWLGFTDGTALATPAKLIFHFKTTVNPILGARLALGVLHFHLFGYTGVPFELKGDAEDSDVFAIQIAMNIARRLVADPRATPLQILGLARALYALERLPASTPGVWVEFGVMYTMQGMFTDKRYIEFLITSDTFEIQRGVLLDNDLLIDSGYECNHISDPGWYFDVYGNRKDDCPQLWQIENEVLELLGFGADFRVDDDSNDMLILK